MQRVDIPKSDRKHQDSGCWWHTGARIVIKCPECDFIVGLPEFQGSGLDHDIKANGNVEPSLMCPNEECSFHRHVKLLNWL